MGELQVLLRKLRGDKSLREASRMIGVSHNYLYILEQGLDKRNKKNPQPSAETLRLISKAYNYPYEKLLEVAGYLDVKENAVIDLEDVFSNKVQFGNILLTDEEKATVLDFIRLAIKTIRNRK